MSVRPWLRDSRWITWALFYSLFTTFASGLILDAGRQRSNLEPGRIVLEPVVARVPFTTTDADETASRRQIAAELEPAVYTANNAYLDQLRDELLSLGRLATDPSIRSIDQIPAESRQKLALTPQTLDELRQYLSTTTNPAWEQSIEAVLDGVAGIPLLRKSRIEVERNPAQRAAAIAIIHPRLRELLRDDKILLNAESDDDRPTLEANIRRLLEGRFPPSVQRSLLAVIMQNPQPTYLYDQQESQRRRQARYDNTPPVMIDKKAGDVLVQAGTTLDRRELQLLDAERRAYDAALPPPVRSLRWIGQFALAGFIAASLWFYVITYHRRIAENPTRGFALTLLFLLAQLIAVAAATAYPDAFYLALGLPILLVAVILCIAYDQRFALAVGALLCLLTTLSLDLPAALGLVPLAGVIVLAAQLDDVRNRSTLVLIGLGSGLAMAIVAALAALAVKPLTLWQPTDFLRSQLLTIARQALWALATGVVAGMVAQTLLPWIEKLFKVTTSMTLRELADLSHPLLRRLAEEAQGTYQHSLRLSDLAEAAAQSIHANDLLCKVGSIYHDIGKISKPEYFIENQTDGVNRHDSLSPTMSHLIIVGHVKDGVELAREFKLPQPLRHFIESHHGTTLIEYFYHAARRQAEQTHAPPPSDTDFRYPGPRPRTKEAGILMICDGIESAARTLDDPTPPRLEDLVRRMTQKRLNDGQLDECNLTLQELHRIQQAVLKTLTAVYHNRVKYPDQTPTPAAAAPTPTPST